MNTIKRKTTREIRTFLFETNHSVLFLPDLLKPSKAIWEQVLDPDAKQMDNREARHFLFDLPNQDAVWATLEGSEILLVFQL